MNLYEFYHTINILCGFTIFIFCACRLGARQWKWQQLEFWVNLILLPSAVAMVVSPVPSANVLIFRLGVAMYFAAQTWTKPKNRAKKRVFKPSGSLPDFFTLILKEIK